jgi:hypothetical protein
LSLLTLHSIIKSNKNIFHDLTQKYQPLLAEINFSDNEPVAQGKENIKKMFMESALGKHTTGQLKLSDFIDEEFFEDIDGNVDDGKQLSKDSDKLPIEHLVAQLRSESNESLFELANTQNGSLTNKFAVMSPILGLILSFTQMLTNGCWKERQASAVGLKIILSDNETVTKQLEYHILQVDQ